MTAFDFFNAIRDVTAEFFPWMVLAVSRPMGFTLLFAAFAWAKLSTGIIRAAFSIAIALPMFANGLPPYGLEGLELPFVVTMVKELMIGMILGLLSSIPLAIAISGGGIIDFYRGSFLGEPDPSGGTTTPYANLFAVVSLWLFASIGGFMIITGTIYGSYEIWSIRSAIPEFSPGAGVILSIMERILLGSVVLAAPLVAIMFFSDIIHLISSKFGKQINVTHLAFSTKNLVAAVILPFFIVSAINLFVSDLSFLEEVLIIAQGIFV